MGFNKGFNWEEHFVPHRKIYDETSEHKIVRSKLVKKKLKIKPKTICEFIEKYKLYRVSSVSENMTKDLIYLIEMNQHRTR